MKPAGCTITRLAPEEVEEILRVVLDGTGALPEPSDLPWLLATCHDGVTWGALRNGDLTLSCEAFPKVSPTPERASLLELRLFGPGSDVRVWRSGGHFRGRRIDDAPDAALRDDPRAPKPESWLLVGDRAREIRDGFTLLTGAAGKRQAVPLEVEASREKQDLPLRLEVCHHLERDEETGALRVALTRWTGLTTRRDRGA